MVTDRTTQGQGVDVFFVGPRDAVLTETEAEKELVTGSRQNLHLVTQGDLIPATESEGLMTDAIS